MASRKGWGEFFARHTDKYPGGVLDTLLIDWQQARAKADALRRPEAPAGERHNRPGPRRIAELLAARFRRAP